MKKALKLALSVMVFSALGLFVGLGIHDSLLPLLIDGAFTRWQALGSPPQTVAKLLGISRAGAKMVVIVESVSGKAYQCCTAARRQWEEIESGSNIFSEPECADLPPRAPRPPGPIMACTEAVAFEWVTERIQFALLEDGINMLASIPACISLAAACWAVACSAYCFFGL